ncbi:MAG: sulfotransferase domain-containing protein, partial [Candidatus Thorarchaeota archaeon]
DRRKPVGKIIKMLTGPIRILPDFLIIGGQRCGTTFYYNCLKQHPNIKTSLRRKEIHFFDNNFHRGLLWYKSYFPTLSSKYFYKYILSHNIITGEASPYYILHPLVPSRVKSIIPNVKIIILLRNPVSRAYSHYNHEVRRGIEKLSFENAIKREKENIDKELKKIMENEHYYSYVFRNYSYITRGIYISQIKNWMEVFPKDQFLIIKSEDLFENPRDVMRKSFKFLNLRNYENITFKKANQGIYSKLDSDIKSQLNEYFRPYNQQLYDYLGVNFNWKN